MDVVSMNNYFKFTHLLYVPTMTCNMACKYCYLEDNTKDEWGKYNALDTLKYAVEKFMASKVIPFNISLHGGEVTTLSKEDFSNVVSYIDDYYKQNALLIESNGFKVNTPHIKTNLYNIDKHLETIKKYNVSISGSLDLPLSIHDKYRVTKSHRGTLDKIMKNIKLLEEIPNRKKVSATIFKEHFNLKEIADDIDFLHKNTCLDMNDFNFMIGFDYNSNGILHPISEEEQVLLFDYMHNRFDGTDLDEGVNGAWFAEFGPNYCTNCGNCGEKFFLLEKNGDIYSCVRGQKNPNYFYGNIFDNTVEEIMENARNKIFFAHNEMPFNNECANCGYLYLCKTGCPFVKNVYNSNKSYTCLLQKKLYQKSGLLVDDNNKTSVYQYIEKMHPNLMSKYFPDTRVNEYKSLTDLIKEDKNLKYIYDSNCFILSVNGCEYNLESQILKNERTIITITKKSEVFIYIKANLLDELCDYPLNNSLYIILLSGNIIEYGDERRKKQEHVASLQVYKNVLMKNISDKSGFFKFDLSPFIYFNKDYLSDDTPNNIFFTTNSLRDYHYTKQKNNAYYHIDAINLPFQNIEFNYIRSDKNA